MKNQSQGDANGSPTSNGLANAGVTGSPRRLRRAAISAGIVAFALTGCATTRYERVYCLSHDQFEQLKKSQPGKVHDQLTGDASKDVGILAGSAIRLRAHDDGLLEVLGGCVDPKG